MIREISVLEMCFNWKELLLHFGNQSGLMGQEICGGFLGFAVGKSELVNFVVPWNPKLAI